MLPPTLIPYLELIRLDRPKGVFLFWFPHIYGSFLAAILLQQPARRLLYANVILAVGTFFMRSANCAWNDIVDAPFDRQVARTRNRPMARGALSTKSALLYTVVLSLVAWRTLAWLPSVCTLYAVPAVFGWLFYPLSKRVTNYPQVVLGFPMAWGIFMGAGALGADPLGLSNSRWRDMSAKEEIKLSPVARSALLYFYAANFAWTLCYETIYSFQDVKDDVHAGVLNLALLLGERRAKPFLTLLAMMVVGNLAWVGILVHAGWLYYTGSVLGVALVLWNKIARVDLSNPASCGWWFSNGGIITGTIIATGLLSEYLARVPSF